MAETAVASPCAKGWGALVLLGFISFIFGLLMLIFPDITALVVLTLIGVIIIIMGVIALIFALFAPAGEGKSTLLLIGGVVGILIGVGFIIYPAIIGTVVTWMLGVVVFFIGIIHLAFAFADKNVPGRGLYIAGAIISIIFAILFLFYPMIGALILFGYLVAIYFLINGIVVIVAGYLMHQVCRELPAA